jgi:hypothetical protein
MVGFAKSIATARTGKNASAIRPVLMYEQAKRLNRRWTDLRYSIAFAVRSLELTHFPMAFGRTKSGDWDYLRRPLLAIGDVRSGSVRRVAASVCGVLCD